MIKNSKRATGFVSLAFLFASQFEPVFGLQKEMEPRSIIGSRRRWVVHGRAMVAVACPGVDSEVCRLSSYSLLGPHLALPERWTPVDNDGGLR